MKLTGNEPAMPTTNSVNGTELNDGGLTIRQQFAAMAMQGLLSNSEIAGKTNYANTADFYNGYAVSAVNMADALIAELNKEKP